MPGNTLLLDAYVPAPAAPPTGGGPVTPGPYSQASVQPVGTAPMTGGHNATLHVAAWGLFWLGVIALMHKWGFHLLSVGRIGRG